MRSIIKWTLTALPFLYMLLIWILSSMPHNAVMELPSRGLDRFLKESLHLVEFGILHILLVLAILAHGRLSVSTHIIAAVIASFYGLLDEVHQAFVPSRSATVIDAFKDLIGVWIAYLLIKRYYFYRFYLPLGRALHKLERWIQKPAKKPSS